MNQPWTGKLFPAWRNRHKGNCLMKDKKKFFPLGIVILAATAAALQIVCLKQKEGETRRIDPGENTGPGKQADGNPENDNPLMAEMDEEPSGPRSKAVTKYSDPYADENMNLFYKPTPELIVKKMLEMGNVTKDDVVYDPGCGDGRIVVAAAKLHGARGVGIDLHPERVQESLENVKKHGVEELVKIKKGNIFRENFEEATVVMLYLFPEVVAKLEPILKKQLRSGSRVVCHHFKMKYWEPTETITIDYDGFQYDLYLYVVP